MQIDTSKISKTTVMGWLVFLVTASQSVKFNAAGSVAMTQKDWFLLAVGVVAAMVGHAQTDADGSK